MVTPDGWSLGTPRPARGPDALKPPSATEASNFEWVGSTVQDEVSGRHHQHCEEAEVGSEKSDLHEFPYGNHSDFLHGAHGARRSKNGRCPTRHYQEPMIESRLRVCECGLFVFLRQNCPPR